MDLIQKKKKITILLILMLIASLSCVFSEFINEKLKNILINQFSIIERNDSLLVHFISVGQGDAIAINLPDDKVMIIDTGPEDSAVTLTNYIEHNVLNNSHNKKIDYLILTHADSDHIGGALRLLKQFDIKNIYIPYMESYTDSFLRLINYIKNGNYNILSDFNDFIDDSSVFNLEIFGPFDNSDTNDSCPIIKLEYLEVSFLFTGDISTNIEEILLLD